MQPLQAHGLARYAERLGFGEAGGDQLAAAPRVDVEALVETICSVAALTHAAGDRLQELDINPLMVLPKGRGVKAADALVVLR